MAAQAQPSVTAAGRARRFDAGMLQLSQVWALEIELTPKSADRTVRIMTGLLSPTRYAAVVYLTAPAARQVVLRAVASLPPGERSMIAVRDLPATAFAPEPPR